MVSATSFATWLIAFVTGLIAAAVAYTALSTVVGIGLGARILYQAEVMRLATGVSPISVDLVPHLGSPASLLLAAADFCVPFGALACGEAAYRSAKRWLAARFRWLSARFTMEG